MMMMCVVFARLDVIYYNSDCYSANTITITYQQASNPFSEMLPYDNANRWSIFINEFVNLFKASRLFVALIPTT